MRVALLSAVARIAESLIFKGMAKKNLETAFGNELSAKKQRDIRRANAHAVGQMAAEWVDFNHDHGLLVERRIIVDDTIALLEETMKLQKGAIMITPHFGNWELIPAYLVRRGYIGAVVARMPANPILAKLLVDIRARAGIETLDALRQRRRIVRVLQSGGIVGILPDLDSKRAAGIFVKFFGKPAWTPIGPAHLSILSGAPIIPTYLIPEDGRYRLIFEPAILPNLNIDKQTEILRLTQAWCERFEARIRAHPEHWVWMHDRWSTTPEKAVERRNRRVR